MFFNQSTATVEPKKRTRRFVKQRLIPYRVLAILLYGSNQAVEPLEEGKVRLSTGPLARALRISINRLLDSLEFLKANQFLTKVEKIKPGQYEITIVKPGAFND